MPATVKFKEENGLWNMGNGGYVYIEDEVMNRLFTYRQVRLRSPESGGLLVGYYKGKDLHVIGMTRPYKRDRQSRYCFHRQDPRHVEQVTTWYRKSKGLINCLGEWHSHPEPNPSPSNIDIRGWSGFIKGRKGQAAIFIIVGTRDVWVGSYRNGL